MLMLISEGFEQTLPTLFVPNKDKSRENIPSASKTRHMKMMVTKGILILHSYCLNGCLYSVTLDLGIKAART